MLLSRVLAARLASVLADLVCKEKYAFLPWRSATDSILLAQEVAHLISSKQRLKSMVLLKVDLAKAFDNVNWSSLSLISAAMGFPARWHGWMDGLLRSVSFFCLINGEASAWFPSALYIGVRQGDPISPFLFLLVMEVFLALVCRGFCPGSTTFSHALFADDVLLVEI